jgi:hypothetical protein
MVDFNAEVIRQKKLLKGKWWKDLS